MSSLHYLRTREGRPPWMVDHPDGRWREYGYDAAHQLTREQHKRANGTTILKHEYTYDASSNRATKEYDDTDTVSYTTDEMNELDSTSGTRGDKIDVTGTVSDATLKTVEVTPNSDTDKKKTAQLRDPFYVARAVELEDKSTNTVDATATDKADSRTSPSDNSTQATQRTGITLETSAAETFTYDSDGRLAQDGSGRTTPEPRQGRLRSLPRRERLNRP